MSKNKKNTSKLMGNGASDWQKTNGFHLASKTASLAKSLASTALLQ